MTGWGQHGPLAPTAGHDLTYLALTGLLHAIGPAGGPPIPPLNLLGDYGGGGAMLAFGVLAAVWQAGRTGLGQVVDAAILDGVAALGTLVYGLWQGGAWQDRRGANLLDGGAPFYAVYETADARWLAVGPLEPRFFAGFAALLGIDGSGQYDVSQWPQLRAAIGERIKRKTRDEWVELFAGSDACVAPVLTIEEAAANGHPHLAARGTFVTLDGVTQPAPAPRFDRTPSRVPAPAALADPAAVLQEWTARSR
jgi:alpha-methylacyl-CoA racemase